MLIAHVADTHLGYTQYGLREREEDFYEAFREVVERVLEEHVDVLVHAGDVFHSPKPPIKALKVAQDAFARLRERGVKVVAILGGHDVVRRRALPPLALYERFNVRVLTRENPVAELDEGLAVMGFEHLPAPYWRRAELKRLLARLASRAKAYRRSVLVLHQAIYPFVPLDYELSVDDLPRGFDYYALGHVHKLTVFRVWGKPAAYSGSTEVVSVSEVYGGAAEKGFLLVDLSGDEAEVQRVKINSVRPQLVFEVSANTLNDVLGLVLRRLAVLESGKEPILHLRVRGELDRRVLERSLSKKLSGKVLKVRVIAASEEAVEEDVTVEVPSLRGLIKEELGSYADLALALLDAFSRGGVEEAIAEAERLFKEFKRCREGDSGEA